MKTSLQTNIIKAGDVVTSSGRYPNVDEDFKRKDAIVLSVEKVDLAYAGNAFITVQFKKYFRSAKYYANALKLA